MAQAAPAQGGIPTFAHLLTDGDGFPPDLEVRLLNTTRKAVRKAGTFTPSNLWRVIADAVRTFRAAGRADVVHVQTALMPLLPLLRAMVLCAAAKLGRAAVLLHVHSGRVNSGRSEAFRPGRFERALIARLAFVDGILTVSDAGTRALSALVDAPVRTVDNAVDVDTFPRASLDGSPVTLLFLGTISQRKGMRDLIDAATILREKGVDGWRLRIVGGAAEVGEGEAGELRRYAAERGFGDAFVGPRTGEDKLAELAGADLFVLPSHWEGQPIAILEAMAAGVPVVTSTVGANPDVIRDGVDGALVEPHDVEGLAATLERLIRSPELRRRMGSAARERAVERHDTSVLFARLEEIYRTSAVDR